MDRLWSSDHEVTVRELFEELTAEREIAYTTVMSTMDNLYRKGWLERRRVGKAYSYWPTMTRDSSLSRVSTLGVAKMLPSPVLSKKLANMPST